MNFNKQPTLIGENFIIRPLQKDDFPHLMAAAADKEIWAQHPAKDRYKPEVFLPYIQSLFDAGGTVVFVSKADQRIIGCSRFYRAPHHPDDWSIGFTFIERKWWGGSANQELKSLMLEHVFSNHDTAWFHIDPDNIRSQKSHRQTGRSTQV